MTVWYWTAEYSPHAPGATPVELLSGEGETAQADTWKRGRATAGSDYGDVPVKLPITTRPVYNSTGDMVLYKMVRFAIFAADGRLDDYRVKDDWEGSKRIAKGVGFLFFGTGLILLALIVYAMLSRLLH